MIYVGFVSAFICVYLRVNLGFRYGFSSDTGASPVLLAVALSPWLNQQCRERADKRVRGDEPSGQGPDFLTLDADAAAMPHYA